MQKIALKKQTDRTTKYEEGYNNVNLFYKDRRFSVEIGIEVTGWGNKTRDTDENKVPIVTLLLGGKEYRVDMKNFIKGAKWAFRDFEDII